MPCQCGCIERNRRAAEALQFDCGFDSKAHRAAWLRVRQESISTEVRQLRLERFPRKIAIPLSVARAQRQLVIDTLREIGPALLPDLHAHLDEHIDPIRLTQLVPAMARENLIARSGPIGAYRYVALNETVVEFRQAAS
jgi:hypothetical protein